MGYWEKVESLEGLEYPLRMETRGSVVENGSELEAEAEDVENWRGLGAVNVGDGHSAVKVAVVEIVF